MQPQLVPTWLRARAAGAPTMADGVRRAQRWRLGWSREGRGKPQQKWQRLHVVMGGGVRGLGAAGERIAVPTKLGRVDDGCVLSCGLASPERGLGHWTLGRGAGWHEGQRAEGSGQWVEDRRQRAEGRGPEGATHNRSSEGAASAGQGARYLMSLEPALEAGAIAPVSQPAISSSACHQSTSQTHDVVIGLRPRGSSTSATAASNHA